MMKQFVLFIFILGVVYALPNVARKPDERVIGQAINATPGLLPWVTGVMFSNFLQCGGALISPDWVVTSAQCVVNYAGPPSIGALSVQAGSLSSVFSSSNDYPVAYVVVHPGYVPLPSIMHHRNIALLKLTKSVPVTPIANSIALPALDQMPIGDHTKVSLAGWGLMWGALGVPLQYVELQTMAIDTCIDVLGGNPSVEHDYNVCTAGYSSTSGLPSGGCLKDHGSPLVWQYALKPLLVGVVSQGGCDTPSAIIPTIYTSTFGHNREWIHLVSGI